MMREENSESAGVAGGYYTTEEPVFLKGCRGAWDAERYLIRGVLNMEVRMGLALVVMLAMALGRLREKRAGLMGCLVRAA